MSVNWSQIRHFDRNEWPKDPSKVNPKLIYTMDDVREGAGVPVWIHVAYEEDGHSPNSYHYRGDAVDFHFGVSEKAGKKLSYLEQFVVLSQYPFGAIGFYPFWNNPGWHVDLRPWGERRLYWVRNRNGGYDYGALDKLAYYLRIKLR